MATEKEKKRIHGFLSQLPVSDIEGISSDTLRQDCCSILHIDSIHGHIWKACLRKANFHIKKGAVYYGGAEHETDAKEDDKRKRKRYDLRTRQETYEEVGEEEEKFDKKKVGFLVYSLIEAGIET